MSPPFEGDAGLPISLRAPVACVLDRSWARVARSGTTARTLAASRDTSTLDPVHSREPRARRGACRGRARHALDTRAEGAVQGAATQPACAAEAGLPAQGGDLGAGPALHRA